MQEKLLSKLKRLENACGGMTALAYVLQCSESAIKFWYYRKHIPFSVYIKLLYIAPDVFAMEDFIAENQIKHIAKCKKIMGDRCAR